MHNVTLTIPTKEHSYTIHIGTGIMRSLADYCDLTRYSSAFIITDEIVAPLWLEELQKAVPIKQAQVILPAGESAKHLASVEQIWRAMHAAGCDRKTLVITLGGGVIGDMGGFAAATYMRGVDCLHMPTTLLAQIDSSIGGKTAIDFDGVKNMIGTFSQPTAVIIDTKTLKTLPDREFLSGFGEIIKHGLIRDAAYLRRATAKKPRDFSATELAEVIAGSCRIKAAVVSGDETEAGPRKLLNFGHTVGHAIESLSLESDHPLLHGEAVSMGMVIEADIAVKCGLLEPAAAQQVVTYLQASGLPVMSPVLPIDAVMQKLRSDKKHAFGKTHFTLLADIGTGIWDQEVPETIVAEALQQHMKGRA